MPPKKKRRTTNSSTPSASPSVVPVTPNHATWPGWCEIESEPAFFNTILQEMGVCGLRVQEVFGVDDTALAILPKPVYAVIFLFRYQKDAAGQQQESECPSHVWFANQIPEYACGTVALLNIVNNIPNLELGQPLQSFKDSTTSFDPVARGHAIDNFAFVRSIHNSFARETDMLNVDKLMKEKNARLVKKQKLEATKAAKAAKDAELATERAAKANQGSSVPRSNPPRRARSSKTAVEVDETDDEEGEGFHFVAYMPIGNEVWKLDGLDSFPTTLGTIPQTEDWLSVVQTTLSIRMAEYEEGQIQFSLMAVVQDPVIDDRRSLAQNTKSLQEVGRRLDHVVPGWRSFIAPDTEDNVIFGPSEEYGLIQDVIDSAILPQSFSQQLESASPEELLKTRQQLITTQAGYRAAVRDGQQAELADAEESMHRRHDYGSFVKGWLQALVDNGTLTSLLEK